MEEKMKGALITGNIKDIIEILLIMVIMTILLNTFGYGMGDIIGFVGTSLTEIYNWFIGLFGINWF